MTSYFVRRDGEETGGCDFVLQVGGNLITGEGDFSEQFGEIDSLESDLLLLGASIFAADRATPRGEREDLGRRIEINLPVVNLEIFLPNSQSIELLLRILSNDSWKVSFRASSHSQPATAVDRPESDSKTLLFSGGLDSLAAAIDLSGQVSSLQLVSHITQNQSTSRAQKQLVAALRTNGLNLTHRQFRVSSRTSPSLGMRHDAEDSQRTRSFLFLALAALSARREGHQEIIFIAENGQLAIHLPLTTARIGAFSTHTASPDFLADMEDFLAKVIGYPISISNPYVHLTKAEVTKKVIDSFPDLIPISSSCWRSARLQIHCGECIPCYIRKISIEFWISDRTSYNREPWTEDLRGLSQDDNGRRNIVELTEFVAAIRNGTVEEIKSNWPELYSDNIDAEQVVKMYQRFAEEAITVLSKYPNLSDLLS